MQNADTPTPFRVANPRSWSQMVWILAGFALAFLVCEVHKVFINGDQQMQFYRYLPAISPIGIDLSRTVQTSRDWLHSGQSPYQLLQNLYPPLLYILLAPVTFLKASAVYALMTYLTLAAYTWLVLMVPRFGGPVGPALPLWFLATGMGSYGLHFELERGQSNVLAVAVALLALLLFKRHPRFRRASFVLLTLAVQAKIYPALFALLFVDDWRDWRRNLRRWALLAAANVALLFVMGPAVFREFTAAFAKFTRSADVLWAGNMSFLSYTRNFLPGQCPGGTPGDLFIFTAKSLYTWLPLLAVLCLAAILVRCIRRNPSDVPPDLLMAVTLLTLLLPSISHDYKLPLLSGPMVYYLASLRMPQRPGAWAAHVLLLLMISLLYAVTLFSYQQRPYYFQNSNPVLMLILLMVTYRSAAPSLQGTLPSRS